MGLGKVCLISICLQMPLIETKGGQKSKLNCLFLETEDGELLIYLVIKQVYSSDLGATLIISHIF